MTPPDAPRSQFEQRMRLRRAATCVSAARVAIEAGRLVEAEDRLEEACRLDPDTLEAALLLEQLRSAEPRAAVPPVLFAEEPSPGGPGRWSHWVAILIAVVSLAALAWWRAPGPDETRFTPARQPEPQRQRRPEPPAVAREAHDPAPSAVLPPGAVPAEDLFASGIGMMPPASSPDRADGQRPERGTSGESPRRPSYPSSQATATPPRRTLAARAEAPDEPARPAPSPMNAAPSTPPPAATVPGLLEERPQPEPRVAEPMTPDPTAPEPAVVPPAVASPAPPATSDAAPASLRHAATDDEAAIGQVLGEYVDAYNRLDASAASRVWPTVDQRALARAFAGLESQGLTFEGCELSVDGAEAAAACHGRARYVPKVGDRDAISQARRWRFRLHRAAAGWVIVQAEAR